MGEEVEVVDLGRYLDLRLGGRNMVLVATSVAVPSLL